MKDIAQQNKQALKVFPGYLKALREDRGPLTPRELAEKAGVSRPSISRYEGGYRLPAIGPAHKIADALGLTGQARGVFFLAAGHSPPGSTIKVNGEMIFDFDEDDDEAPIIHGLLSAA